MLDGIEALAAVDTFGTMTEASTRLRITQSAVSKRLATLAAQVGYAVVEPEGRRVKLTPRGAELLRRARPLMAELRALTKPDAEQRQLSWTLALANSVASSWGPAVVRKALDRCPGVEVELHAHRSVLVIESVRLGRYDIGLSAESAAARDLVAAPVVDEAMVVLHSALATRFDRAAPLITIEPTSATWRAIQPLLQTHHPELLASRLVFVESFGAVAQMARAGFGNGLLPMGLAHDLGAPARTLLRLPRIRRTLSVFTRKTLALQPAFDRFRVALTAAARDRLS
jgi:DNA-binding transcriptional LysR family regulator